MKHFIIRSTSTLSDTPLYLSRIHKDGSRQWSHRKGDARKFNRHAAELLIEEWSKDSHFMECYTLSIEGTGIMSTEEQAEVSDEA